MRVKEESEKVGLKLNIQKTKIMASSPITSWQIDGETVTDYFWGAPRVFPGVMYGCKSWIIIKLSAKELMLLNCGAGEDS